MKKIFASVGMIALGAASVHATGAMDTAKTWSVSATLRGFYDDNYTTAPKGSEEDSWGFSISPSVGLSLPLDQSTFALRYTFGAYWYQDRADSQAVDKEPWDYTHQFDALFNHQFNERFSLDASDSFVIAQEPQLLDPTGATTNPYRVEGNNIRNYGLLQLNSRLTEKWSAVLGYRNTFYDYESDNPANESQLGFFLNGQVPSLSAVNDRMEQTFLLNLRWQMQKETVGVLGYNFAMNDYSSDEIVALDSLLNPIEADTRNSRSHFLYAGVDHNFSSDLQLSLRLGAQDADFYNDPTSNTDITPYGDLSLTYIYRPGSNFRLGASHSRSHTDVIAYDAAATENQLTSDQQSTVLYASLTHALTPKLTGILSGQWQLSEFDGGLYDTQKEQYLGFNAMLRYEFTRHYFGEIGYNYSTLDSDIGGRDYDRNRYFIGLTATY